MKLDITSGKIETIEAYNKHMLELQAQAKKESDMLYGKLRNNIKEPHFFTSDDPVKVSFVEKTIDVMRFNRQRKLARKQAHQTYDTVMHTCIDTDLEKARDKALSEIKKDLYSYGYSMAYLNRVAEPILLDLYRAYLLDKSTKFSLPIDMKLEGHMNAVLNNVGLNLTADNFFAMADVFTGTGHSNGYHAPVRSDVDRDFVCRSDDAFKYAVACRTARMQFFDEINHDRMSGFTPKTSEPYAKTLAKLSKSPVYTHTETRRKGKNPYSRLLSLYELNSMLQYEDIVKSGHYHQVEKENIPSMLHMYEAFIDYHYDPSNSMSRHKLLATMPSAISFANDSGIRCSEMSTNIKTLTRAREYISRNDYIGD